MTELQRRAVQVLYYLYGNAGPYYSRGNHEYLRRTLAGEEKPECYQPSDACKEALKKVLANDWSPLPPKVQAKFAGLEEERKRLQEVAGIKDEDLEEGDE